jgi:DNA ligase-1
MKTFENVLSALNEIASVPGKKDKEALVKKHLENTPDFEKVVVLMLNPFKRFYIKNFEPATDAPSTWNSDDAYFIFDELAKRNVSGNEARYACGRLVAAGFPADLMIRILNKDPKAGFGESTVNKAKKGIIPDFPYMRCALPKDAKFSTWDWKKGVISQEKADGMYCTINKSTGDIAMMSRSGKPFDTDSFPGIVEAAKKMLNDNTQTQGELLVINAAGEVQPREIGNGMLNKIAQGGVWPDGFSPIYHAWDQIPLSEVKTKVKYNVGYLARLTALEAQLGEHSQAIAVIDTRVVHNMDEAKAHYREMLEAGKEGTILSEPNAPWVDSTSKFKIKFKLTATCELVITGWRPGKNKNKDLFGSLICESSDGLLEVAVSGFTDSHRKEIFESIDSYIGTIMSVDSNMIMEPSRGGKKWSLFLPRFAEFRKDKTEADSLDKIKEQFEAAIQLA